MSDFNDMRDRRLKVNGAFLPSTGDPAPLSPIALDQEVGLDFEAAEKAAQRHDGYSQTDNEAHLNRQLRALVARVAQEEREKYEERLRSTVKEARANAFKEVWRWTDNMEQILHRNPRFTDTWNAVGAAVVSRGDDLSMNLDIIRAKRLGKAAVLAYLESVCPLPKDGTP